MADGQVPILMFIGYAVSADLHEEYTQQLLSCPDQHVVFNLFNVLSLNF